MIIGAACTIWEWRRARKEPPPPPPVGERNKNSWPWQARGEAAALELHLVAALGVQHHAGFIRAGDVDREFLEDVADLGDECGV